MLNPTKTHGYFMNLFLFLVMICDPTSKLQIFFSSYADDAKMRSKSSDVEIIHSDLPRMVS